MCISKDSIILHWNNKINYMNRKRGYKHIHAVPITLIAVGLAACAISATLSEAYWDFLGLLLISSLATLLCGAILGFLFGVPKLNKNYDPGEDYNRTNKYNPNTNLEDVSDWLTKIIIGVTLTQLNKIPGYLQSIAGYMLLNSNCDTLNCHMARPVIIAAIIYFAIAGFITGYLYTRAYLPNLFMMMEENRMKDAEIAIWREGVKEGIKKDPEAVALTDEEQLILRKIESQDNHISLNQQLTFRERAAINVLLSKGVVEMVQDSSPEKGTMIKIHPEQLHSLSTKEK